MIFSDYSFSQHLHCTLKSKEQKLWIFILAILLLIPIGIALVFEYIGGILPCKLCIIERFPYYGSLIFLSIAALSTRFFPSSAWIRSLFWGIFILMVISLILAIYHAGAEYRFWDAPNNCTSHSTMIITDASHLLNQLNAIQSPSCNQAAGYFLFLSFAGWNAVASLVLMLISLFVASKGLLKKQ
ncbi:Disulfide bond formation protein DsbB [Bartonella sp. CDC_skunk]|uniref:Disulfide bond formation protein B n=1 Tax=Bartonella rochalimae ATCC BAA-1498 TaxID=685782 RepID=A0A067W4F6_9HYPH|nr:MULTISPECIES: disulfide bond formation protein B [Bartonella]AQX18877.1 Disulfide bond formation protein DsbB [Bartonella sp. A1379B]AQX21886.1 Disulfide bond formation protein DsbB [Bartonella sp. CDC_skunk]AQX22101.1 Disulfide bond formation protein DsbB [Bartonella sp. 11B]AQX24620.1 Disulfide bond formation protein DsbB [Bartonella sp. 114]AQX25869.1 Disulfide bond formation protein DsbB [Bartonella sp. Coyote22sub2]